MRRIWLWIRNSHGHAWRKCGQEHGQMEVMQAILDEYDGEMKRIPKRVRRAWIAMEGAP